MEWTDTFPPAIYAIDVEKGNAIIMLATTFHKDSHSRNGDKKCLVIAVFAARGYLRRRGSQFLTVPQKVARKYPGVALGVMGYSLPRPCCGYFEQPDPPLTLLPEIRAEISTGIWS